MTTPELIIIIQASVIICLVIGMIVKSDKVYKAAKVVDKFETNIAGEQKFFMVVRQPREHALDVEVDQEIYKSYKTGDTFSLLTN